MSNIKLIIEESADNIGKLMVGRLLPFRQKRMVGSFICIDHMGPVKLSERENFDLWPHPHISLSTLTFLFESSIMHRDTLGKEVKLKPDAVNWMTAGKGIAHSERKPEYLRNSPLNMLGFQIGVALPKHLEQIEPQFSHIEEQEIPRWTIGDLQFKLFAGKAFGRKCPVPVFNNLFMLEIKNKTMQTVNIGDELYGESGLYIIEDAIESEGYVNETKQVLVAKDNTLCDFTIKENSTIYIFGGNSFPEVRFNDWNFVSSSIELIEEAKQKWKDQSIAKIEGDEKDYIFYPTFRRK